MAALCGVRREYDFYLSSLKSRLPFDWVVRLVMIYKTARSRSDADGLDPAEKYTVASSFRGFHNSAV